MYLNNDVDVYRRVVPLLLTRLQAVLDWFRKQRRFAFFASSLLLVYEGAVDRWTSERTQDGTATSCDGDNVEPGAQLVDVRMIDGTATSCDGDNVEPGAPLVDVRMIDFAHVFPSQDRDDNYIDGIESLVKYLHRLL